MLLVVGERQQVVLLDRVHHPLLQPSVEEVLNAPAAANLVAAPVPQRECMVRVEHVAHTQMDDDRIGLRRDVRVVLSHQTGQNTPLL